MSESIYFVIFPYAAVIIAVAVGLLRFFTNRFSYSSISSQFLENRALFWGSVPWHYGIILILLMHVSNAAFPGFFAALNRDILLQLVLEIIGLPLAVLTLFGLITLLIRRMVSSRVRAVTSMMDWILIVDLLLQVAAGTYISLSYRWGGLWYLYTAAPWLSSLFNLVPKSDFITPLPWIIRFHAVNAFVVIALCPFTRLVHIFSVPISYLRRSYQVVMWNSRTSKD